MPSTLTWLDYSEKERRKNLDIVSLFKNQDTRDELGLGRIRDAFADALFPGTGTVQTRARYFLFIPWIYKKLEDREVTSAQIGEKARQEEIRLIFALEKSGEKDGVIGIEARKELQRLPSNIYWLGLNSWGIRPFSGSQSDYHHSLDRWYKNRHTNRNDDKEPVSELFRNNWHSMIPAPPNDFPGTAKFGLSETEAVFLRDQIRLCRPHSLLAFLVMKGKAVDQVQFPWMHHQYHDFPTHNKRELQHARNVSEVMHGAALLYNLMLAELTTNDERIKEYGDQLKEWGRHVDADLERFRDWSREEFWALVRNLAKVHPRTRDFINAWIDLVITRGIAKSTAKSASARSLIRFRETELKGSLARLENVSARELWKGAAGAGQIDFRWPNAQVIVNDILNGLEARSKHA